MRHVFALYPKDNRGHHRQVCQWFVPQNQSLNIAHARLQLQVQKH